MNCRAFMFVGVNIFTCTFGLTPLYKSLLLGKVSSSLSASVSSAQSLETSVTQEKGQNSTCNALAEPECAKS